MSRSRILPGLLLCAAAGLSAVVAQPVGEVLDVVRSMPYSASQGVAGNLATVRRWVLFGDSFCEVPDRHLLMDRQWRFLGYIEDAATSEETILRLNEVRQDMAEAGRVSFWIPGSGSEPGYPYAFSCDQPYADMSDAIARVTGSKEEYRLWGTWDGMSIGSESAPVSLQALFEAVVEYRRQQGRISFPDDVLPVFLGKVIIESGGNKNALSAVSAIGILQLLPEVLDDCRIPESFRRHRIAQVDCALRLVQQNHRNLQEPFRRLFGNLPADKQSSLYSLLLVQSYQIGIGRAIQLLSGPELGRAAQYFADHHERFSAEDILVGMIYHNLGREDIGMRSLYYVTDTRLAAEALAGL